MKPLASGRSRRECDGGLVAGVVGDSELLQRGGGERLENYWDSREGKCWRRLITGASGRGDEA